MTPVRWYAIGFVAVIGAAALLGFAGLGSLRSVGLLRASIAASAVASVGGIVALASARRR